jgi:ribosomal protein S27E
MNDQPLKPAAGHSGFEITCMVCNAEGGEIAYCEVNRKPMIAVRCPRCQRIVAKPTNGTAWSELAPGVSGRIRS